MKTVEHVCDLSETAALPKTGNNLPKLAYQVRGKKNAQRTQTKRIYMCELHVNVISSTGALRIMGDKTRRRHEPWESSRTDSRLAHTIANSQKTKRSFPVKISDN